MGLRREVAGGLRVCTAAVLAIGAAVGGGDAWGEPLRDIVIDGAFDDWAWVPSYTDAADDQHDTDHDQIDDVPGYVDHPDVDLLEYKFAHDKTALYAYFRARGAIGRTQTEAQGRAGRYYGIVTLDVDNDDSTGYWIHEGGYYPTSPGYDMNMEVEWYNGAYNTGHYINHGARNDQELAQAVVDQMNGIVRILPGTYEFYTQWVMFDDDSIVFVADRGPVYYGIVEVAVSEDGREMEMKAPFRGFMKDPEGQPIVALGKTIDLSFSLEASGELAPGQAWASDTADPIEDYYLGGPQDSPWDVNFDGFVDAEDLQLVVNAVLQFEGMDPAYRPDVNRDLKMDALDVQSLVNRILEAVE
jgi:hypothetical protein